MSVMQFTTADFRLSASLGWFKVDIQDNSIVILIVVWQWSMCSDYALEFTSVQDKELDRIPTTAEHRDLQVFQLKWSRQFSPTVRPARYDVIQFNASPRLPYVQMSF